MNYLRKTISNMGMPVHGVRGGSALFKLLFFALFLSICSEPVLASDVKDEKKKNSSINIIGEITPLIKRAKKVSGSVSNYAPTGTISGTATVCRNATTYITFTGSGGTAPYTFEYFATGLGTTTVTTTGGSSSVDILANTSGGNRNYILLSVTDDVGGYTDHGLDGLSAGITVVNPTATISGGPLTICQNVVGTNLTVTFSGGTAPYTLTYAINGVNQTPVVSASATTNIAVSSTLTGTFNYSLVSVQESSLSCTNVALTSNTTVTVSPLPQITVLPSTTPEICEGQTNFNVIFGTANNPTQYSIVWGAAALAQSFPNLTNEPFDQSNGIVAVTVTNTAPAATYTGTLTFTTSAGCTTSGSAFVTINPLPILGTITGLTPVCVGSTINLSNSLTGGSWTVDNANSTIGISSGVLTGSAAGTSIVTYSVTNVSGCSSLTTTTVTINPLPILGTITGVSPVCIGSTLTLSNSLSSGSWTVDNANSTIGISSGLLTGSAAGTSIVTYSVTNGSGCSSLTTTTVTINSLPDVTVSLTGLNTFCAGGSATLSVPNVAGSSYLWTGGGTNFDRVVTTTGGYTVTVTNTAGCTATSSATNITVNALPDVTVTLTGSNTFCAGGSATLSVPNVAGSSYLWTGGGINFDRVVTTGGGYTVTVTNTAGCTATSSATNITVNALPDVTVTLTGSNTFCAGGSATLSVPNVAGSSYLWTGGGTNFDRVVTTGGGYAVTVTNTAGCTATSSVTNITVNALPDVTVTLTGSNTFCAGGSATLSVPNVAGSSYLWTGGGTNFDRVVTTSGGYTVTVTNTAGCTATSGVTNITVNALPDVTVTLTGSNTFCAGGSATLSVPNVAGSSYLWTGGGTNFNRVVTTSGGYTVTATNTAGCTATSTTTNITVNALPTPIINASGPLTFCIGNSVNLTASGGNTYAWSNGTNAALTNIVSSGTYSVTVTNAAGCTAVASRTVTVNPLPTPVINASGPLTFCAGNSVNLTASGGTSYVWSNTSTNASITNITTSGTYSVTVTDANNCSATSAPVTITVNTNPTVAITNPAAVCSPGTVDLTASAITTGSTNGLNYSYWSNAAGTQNLSTPFAIGTAGTYYIRGTNTVTNCATIQPVTVNINPQAVMQINTPAAVCSPQTVDLTAAAITNGSAAGLSYTYFTNAAATTSLSNANAVNASGVYYIKGTPVSGCSAVVPVTVTINPLPTLVINNPAAVCSPQAINLTESTITAGSSAGLSFAYFSNAALTTPVNNAQSVNNSGTFYIRATDATTGCVRALPVTVQINAAPQGVLQTPATNIICENGSLALNASGGNSYQWLLNQQPITGATASTYTATAAGNYAVRFISAQNCEAVSSNTIQLELLNKPTVQFTLTNACAGVPTSFNNTSITSASGGINWLWDFGDGSSSNQFSPAHIYTSAGTYAVRLTATSPVCNGFNETSLVTYRVQSAIPAIRYKDVDVLKDIPATVTARAIGTSFLWLPSTGVNNNRIASPSIRVSTTTEYTVAITNDIGCTTTDTVLLKVIPGVDIYVPQGFTPNNDGQNDRLYPILVGMRQLNYFRVFNRWGHMIFTTKESNAASGWNGLYLGVMQPMGTYTWMAEAIDLQGNVVRKTGTVLLLQ